MIFSTEIHIEEYIKTQNIWQRKFQRKNFGGNTFGEILKKTSICKKMRPFSAIFVGFCVPFTPFFISITFISIPRLRFWKQNKNALRGQGGPG